MFDTLKGAEEMIDRLTAELATCRDAVRKHQLVLFDENAKVVKLRGELERLKKVELDAENHGILNCNIADGGGCHRADCDMGKLEWSEHQLINKLRAAEEKLENTHSYIDTYDCTGKSAHKFKDDLLRWLATILTEPEPDTANASKPSFLLALERDMKDLGLLPEGGQR